MLAIIESPRGELSNATLTRPLIDSVLDGRTAHTARAYLADYKDFARFLSSSGPAIVEGAAGALEALISFAPGTAHSCVILYRSHLVNRKLSPATIARRLAALRTAVKLARMTGRVTWSLEVESPPQEAYRDTSGPGMDGWLAILEYAEADKTPAGIRNLAIVRLLHDLALRRGEVVGLDLVDYEPSRSAVAVKGKGRHHRIRLTLSAAAKTSIESWILERGDWAGPLFVSLATGRAVPGSSPLTGEAVRQLVKAIAAAAGVDQVVRPHGLRHQAITEALDKTGGDVRRVARFSRHKRIETVMKYDDNRADFAGEIASLIS